MWSLPTFHLLNTEDARSLFMLSCLFIGQLAWLPQYLRHAKSAKPLRVRAFADCAAARLSAKSRNFARHWFFKFLKNRNLNHSQSVSYHGV